MGKGLTQAADSTFGNDWLVKDLSRRHSLNETATQFTVSPRPDHRRRVSGAPAVAPGGARPVTRLAWRRRSISIAAGHQARRCLGPAGFSAPSSPHGVGKGAGKRERVGTRG